MSKKNKNTLSQALLDMEKITSTIKESSEDTLKSMLSEAVKTAIRESVEDKEEVDDEAADTEDEDMEIVDNTEESTEDSNGAEDETESEEDSEAHEDAVEDETDDEDWSEADAYKVGDDTYDLTGVNDYEEVMKVYRRLKDDDEVLVKKQGDKIQISDKGNDADYIIDLGTEDSDSCKGEECDSALNESFDEPTEDSLFGEDEFEFEFDDEMGDEPVDDFEFDDEFEASEADGEDEIAGLPSQESFNEGKKSCMKKKQETLFEIDLGYTDNYQDKDAVEGLSVEEPSKTGRSWDKGVPTTAGKRFAGIGTEKKGIPFDNAVSEEIEAPVDEVPVEEGTNVTLPNKRKKVKSHSPQPKETPQVAHHDSVAGDYKAMNEALKKENEMLKKSLKKLKECVVTLKGNLNEALVANVSIGRAAKLMIENTTSKNEKMDILNRFSQAKTVDETLNLYEAINKEFSNKKKVAAPIQENSFSSEKKMINENQEMSRGLMATIDLMKKIDRR